MRLFLFTICTYSRSALLVITYISFQLYEVRSKIYRAAVNDEDDEDDDDYDEGLILKRRHKTMAQAVQRKVQ